MARYDVAVIGLGGIGSAVLGELANRDLRVIGIDRFSPPHDLGSSHGHTRVIRQAYFEHPDYVPLLRESYQGWHEIERSTGRQLLFPVGLLQAGPRHGRVIQGVRRAAAEHGLPLENLTRREVSLRWPGIIVPTGLDTVIEATAGYLLAELSIETWLDFAQNHGATIVRNTCVKQWDSRGGQLQLSTDGGEQIACDRLIVTAGPWANELLGELGIGLQLLRKSLFWHKAPPEASHWPIYLFELPSGVFYGFPNVEGQGVKLGEHSGGDPMDDPLAVNREVSELDRQRVDAFRRECLQSVGEQERNTSCIYTMTRDSHFVVDRWPGDSRIAFAAGLSGHGFKFAPVLARALADLVLRGGSELPIEFLSLKRFVAN